jgi:hypothetical protein
MNESINPMCLTCKKYKNSCKGEKNCTYTGCIYKEGLNGKTALTLDKTK